MLQMQRPPGNMGPVVSFWGPLQILCREQLLMEERWRPGVWKARRAVLDQGPRSWEGGKSQVLAAETKNYLLYSCTPSPACLLVPGPPVWVLPSPPQRPQALARPLTGHLLCGENGAA